MRKGWPLDPGRQYGNHLLTHEARTGKECAVRGEDAMSETASQTAETAGGRSPRQAIGLWLGPALALGLQLLGVPDALAESAGSAEAGRAAWIVLSLLILMAVWWVSEAIPIPVTSLLPIVILPFFGVLPISAAAAPYMHPIVVLLMGGFIVAKAIERWHLHSRIALNIVARVGDHPAALIGGFMVAAAALSMWISNTATSIMMMPIALSVAAAVLGEDRIDSPFTFALLLGIAWACSIGGLGTIIGTPTNAIIIGWLNENAGFSIGFGQWMMIGLPSVILLIPLAWFVLTRLAFDIHAEDGAEAQAVVREHLRALGPISTPELRTIGLFAVVALLWMFRTPLEDVQIAGIRPFGGLTDHLIAILGVILCFLIPSGSRDQKGSALLDWKTAESIPWGVLLLFGGGMSLAGAITATGLGTWIGGELAGLAVLPILLLVAVLTGFVIFATEVTSNVATASALMPVLGAVALAAGIDVELLAVPLALAASCAFMLPMATGPNAVVFATGHLSLPTMARAGFLLNLLAILVITGLGYLLAPLVF